MNTYAETMKAKLPQGMAMLRGGYLCAMCGWFNMNSNSAIRHDCGEYAVRRAKKYNHIME